MEKALMFYVTPVGRPGLSESQQNNELRASGLIRDTEYLCIDTQRSRDGLELTLVLPDGRLKDIPASMVRAVMPFKVYDPGVEAKPKKKAATKDDDLFDPA